ncbi:minor capsid protein [Microbacterium maritypicum]
MNDSTLTRIVCSLLSDIPGWEWRPDGPSYQDTETAIFYGAIDATPDRAVGARVYSATDDPVRSLSSRRMQLRLRGRKDAIDDADNLAHLAFLRLQGLSRVEGISGIRRESMSPSTADDNGRQERTENYTIILDNQEASS